MTPHEALTRTPHCHHGSLPQSSCPRACNLFVSLCFHSFHPFCAFIDGGSENQNYVLEHLALFWRLAQQPMVKSLQCNILSVLLFFFVMCFCSLVSFRYEQGTSFRYNWVNRGGNKSAKDSFGLHHLAFKVFSFRVLIQYLFVRLCCLCLLSCLSGCVLVLSSSFLDSPVFSFFIAQLLPWSDLVVRFVRGRMLTATPCRCFEVKVPILSPCRGRRIGSRSLMQSCQREQRVRAPHYSTRWLTRQN